jgi:hypothetical protein
MIAEKIMQAFNMPPGTAMILEGDADAMSLFKFYMFELPGQKYMLIMYGLGSGRSQPYRVLSVFSSEAIGTGADIWLYPSDIESAEAVQFKTSGRLLSEAFPIYEYDNFTFSYRSIATKAREYFAGALCPS